MGNVAAKRGKQWQKLNTTKDSIADDHKGEELCCADDEGEIRYQMVLQATLIGTNEKPRIQATSHRRMTQEVNGNQESALRILILWEQSFVERFDPATGNWIMWKYL